MRHDDVRGLQALPDLVRTIGAVEKEGCAACGNLQHIGPFQPLELMTGNEARALDQVGGTDRERSEPKVRDRHGTRLA